MSCFLKSAPSVEQFVNDVKNLMLESAARASAVFTSAKFQSDTFKDATGINSGSSSGYTHRGASNYDVIVNTGATKESQTTKSAQAAEIFSNVAASERGAGHVFTAGSSYNLSKVTFNLSKLGSPTGNLRAALYAVSAGIPTGAALATSAGLNVSTIAASQTDYEFTFSSSYAVVNGTQYAVVLERNGAYTGDGSNHIKIYGAGSGASDVRKSNADAWTAAINTLYFINKEAAAASADIRSVTLTLPAAVTQVVMCADVTLNTGTAAYYVSTDGGSSWTSVSIADLQRLITVPSGSQIVARVVLTGDAELEFLSVAAAA